MAINYPTSLPAPQVSVVSTAEGRQLSNDQRPLFARALSTDFIEYERIEFPALTRSQADLLNQFWETDLVYGGAWFNATWPLPRGLVEAVRKFITPLQWTYRGRGFWKITAYCEVRRRSEPVQAIAQFYSPWNDNTKTGEDNETLQSYWTLSNDGYTATASAGESNIVSLHSITSGDRYGEIRVNFESYPIGLADVVAGLSRNNPESPRDSLAISLDGVVWLEGAFLALIDPLVDNDVVGVAVEGSTGRAWLSVNGSWILGGSPAARTDELATFGPVEFWLGFALNSAIDAPYSGTLRTFAPFSYSPPAGFSPWYEG